MCGINGILHYEQKEINEQNLLKMRDILSHRGPDSAGIYINKNLGLGHRRLSIIDTSAGGHQPFVSQSERYVIVFNGEIYNYKSFYPELKSKGINLKTGSDTEVLLHLYECYGLSMLSRLNGMFAFAIWDNQEKELVLVRDRMGVKPLYYTVFENTLYFASEQKALFTAGVPLKISQEGLQEYFFNRFVAGSNTLYQNIFKLLPGHSMIVNKEGKVKTNRWWNLKNEIQNYQPIVNPKKWFEETFFDSVQLRMVSDVPVGVLLSGGLDSCAVLSSLYHQDFKNIQTFNIAFSESKYDESFLAKNITNNYDYIFNSITLEGDELYNNLMASTYNQDEPIMHLNEPHLLSISKLAHQKVKVLLSGEGSDELMGGYMRYKTLKHPSLLKAISYLSNFDFLVKNSQYNKLFRYSKINNQTDLLLFNSTSIYPNDIDHFYNKKEKPINTYRHAILKEAQELYPKDLQRQALYFDQHTYICSLLDRNDRCTMGASVECREPFLDQRLVAGLGTLDTQLLLKGKKGKYILKSVMENRLPSDIVNFRKNGLSTPWQNYLVSNNTFQQELDFFGNSDIFNMPFLENIDGKKLVDSIRKRESNIIPYVMPIFMFYIWHKNYVKKFD